MVQSFTYLTLPSNLWTRCTMKLIALTVFSLAIPYAYAMDRMEIDKASTHESGDAVAAISDPQTILLAIKPLIAESHYTDLFTHVMALHARKLEWNKNKLAMQQKILQITQDIIAEKKEFEEEMERFQKLQELVRDKKTAIDSVSSALNDSAKEIMQLTRESSDLENRCEHLKSQISLLRDLNEQKNQQLLAIQSHISHIISLGKTGVIHE